MSDDAQLAEQAWAAAVEIVDRYMTFPDTDDGAEARAQFLACTAVGWRAGRRADRKLLLSYAAESRGNDANA